MKRRQLLSVAALSVSLSGCAENNRGDATEAASPTSVAAEPATRTDATTETETPSPEPATDIRGCEWPKMCEGSQLVKVVVRSGYLGDVVLAALCRDETFTVAPGESVRIDREEDGESCYVSLFVGGEQVYARGIPPYKRVTLTVNSDGTVERDAIVY